MNLKTQKCVQTRHLLFLLYHVFGVFFMKKPFPDMITSLDQHMI
jgi:hypothetical protein